MLCKTYESLGKDSEVRWEFVLIISDTSVKHQLIKFNSIETVVTSMKLLDWQESGCGAASLSSCW